MGIWVRQEEIEEEIEDKQVIKSLKIKDLEDINSRFIKLTKVDMKYDYTMKKVFMQADDLVSLEELTSRFINFSAYKLGLLR